MLHPVGPLPASVYWRRRALAFAAVVVVLLVGRAVLPGGDDGPRNTAAAVGSPTPDAGTPSSLAATPPAGGRGGSGGGGSTDTTTAASSPTPASTPQPPPQPCPDQALQLRVVPERPAYPVGEQPVLDLVVRNISAVACMRDLGAAYQEVLLYDGHNRRLWSSNDCYPGGSKDPQVLGPGDSASFSVTWSGLSSRPKCAGERVRVTAGGYALVGRLGTLVSARSPIRLT